MYTPVCWETKWIEQDSCATLKQKLVTIRPFCVVLWTDTSVLLEKRTAISSKTLQPRTCLVPLLFKTWKWKNVIVSWPLKPGWVMAKETVLGIIGLGMNNRPLPFLLKQQCMIILCMFYTIYILRWIKMYSVNILQTVRDYGSLETWYSELKIFSIVLACKTYQYVKCEVLIVVKILMLFLRVVTLCGLFRAVLKEITENFTISWMMH